MPTNSSHTIRNGLEARISVDGAELCSLLDTGGRELLWQAGPLWPSHSPILFPIVGQVANDSLSIDGRAYPMSRHGFARRRTFEWVSQAQSACSLSLSDDDHTRAVFPFAFRLDVTYRVDPSGLTVEYELHNPGATPLPASLGAHPAFRWPLVGGAQADYRIEFERAEPEPIYRLAAGLLDQTGQPSPIRGDRLDLDPALFLSDAIILLAPRSTSLRYLGPAGGLRFSWSGFPQLGLWQKPGAEFICLEPWHGYSSPNGWAGEFRDKPGVMSVAPGQSRHFSWTVQPIDG